MPLQQHLTCHSGDNLASISYAALLQTLTPSQTSMPGFNGIWPQWTGPGRRGSLWACMRHGEGLHSQGMHAAQQGPPCEHACAMVRGCTIKHMHVVQQGRHFML